MTDTPMFKQYKSFKEKYSDCILFFRLGDFYEMFSDDAKEVSSLLSLTLTHRTGESMCGIPYHAAANYIKKLLEFGKKIAICEQLSLSESFRNIAKRDVIRVITPGTVVEENFLEQTKTNYILCIYENNLAFCDISTGDFYLKKLDAKNSISGLRETLEQISPSELLTFEDEYFTNKDFRAVIDGTSVMNTKLPSWYFSLSKGYNELCAQAGVNNLKGFGLSQKDSVLSAGGALLLYLKETSKDGLKQISSYILLDNSEYLAMDESTRRNLELFTNLYDGKQSFSLFNAINRCKTLSGGRLLKEWISFPLHNIEKIRFRQNWAVFFKKNTAELNRIKGYLSNSLDLNRLTSRVLMQKASPHDCVSIAVSIKMFFSIVSENTERYKSLFTCNMKEDVLEQVLNLATEIDTAINSEFLGLFNAGSVINPSYDKELDRLRGLKENSSISLNSYLEKEKQKTGLSVLKLGYNKIIGYYLEVSKGQLSKVPSYFIRRQTLVTGERFSTEELSIFEREILDSATRADQREKELFDSVCEKIISVHLVLKDIAYFLSLLDVFSSFATLSLEQDYCMPEIAEEDVLQIKEGRHPVVEKYVTGANFTANDLFMEKRFYLITGPNMAGKSTFLRQNAIIILLAHIGCFVPASYAKIGLTDKIFCRVGAMDNLGRGESTFLVEMQETAYILRNCTERSFVIVDEIGRGTSSQDGMAIAYAVMRHLIQKNCKTLFATHYHELTMVNLSDISLKTLEVLEKNGKIQFLRRVIDGKANSSYGIHVAKLAGMPYSVLKEAVSFQNKHTEDFSMEQGSLFTVQEERESVPKVSVPSNLLQIREILEKTDLNTCTPIEAFNLLVKMKNVLSEEI